MCGIVGVIAKNRIRHMLTDEIFMMCQYQQHRGPDDKGVVALDLEMRKIREVKSGGAQDHAGIHPSLFWAEIKRKIKEKCFIIN